MNILVCFMLFLIYSFIGWVIEILDSIIENRRIINRGFLIGPYCPIYGVGALLIMFFLTKYKYDIVVLFVMSVLICSILEYLTSYFMEKIYKIRWWDYSNKKFNLNGRICLETTIPFGLLGCLMIYILNPFFLNLINLISYNTLYVISVILIILFIIDVTISLSLISKLKLKAEKIKKDSTEEIKKKIKEMIFKKNALFEKLGKSFTK